jgi:hypothetical protein
MSATLVPQMTSAPAYWTCSFGVSGLGPAKLQTSKP